ncbi:MAG: hypothetical protein QXI32_00985 [Candidatus Bathyarchaeia archaeon]
MLVESLNSFGFNPILVIDEKENVLSRFYEHFSTYLLSKRITWNTIGHHIASKVAVYRPTVAMVFLDVCAGAAMHLHRQGVRTVTFVEDLTVTYHNSLRTDRRTARQIMEILSNELKYSELVVTPSYLLSKLLREEYGLEASTVPIGTKPYVTIEEAYYRKHDLALHVGQIHDRRQALILSRISQELSELKIDTLAHKAGKYMHLVKGVKWYRYGSPEEAIPYVKNAFLGIVARYRPAFTLSSLYYHIGLLQPILVSGEGPWMQEAQMLGIDMIKDKNEIDSISLRKQADAAERLAIPKVHKPLAEALSKL